MAPPRCLNRQDDIFLFFFFKFAPLALPPSPPFFLFFFYLFFTPTVPLRFKGKVFGVCTRLLLTDPGSPPAAPLAPAAAAASR